jgi:hypothetical protein
MHKESAEEKLLKLIKGPGAHIDKQARQNFKPQKNGENLKSNHTPGFEQLIFGQKYLARIKHKTKTLSLSSINKFLTVAALAILIFFIFDFVFSARSIKKMLKEQGSLEEKSDIAYLPKKLEGQFVDYNKRDIFRGSFDQATSESRQIMAFDVAKYVSNLKLIGIISGEKLQAIIEDGNDQKTYNVTPGDYFKDFLVDEISNGKLRLDYKGEKFDLFL